MFTITASLGPGKKSCFLSGREIVPVWGIRYGQSTVIISPTKPKLRISLSNLFGDTDMKPKIKFPIGLTLIIVLMLILLSIPTAFSQANNTHEGGSGNLAFGATGESATNQQLTRDLENLARAELIDQLSLEDGTYEMMVQDIRFDASSALVEMRLITQSELVGEIDEIINVYAFVDGSEVTAVFREPSLKFFKYADKVSPNLLPPDRLAFWRELRESEATLIERAGLQALYRMPFDGGTQRPVAQDFDKHFDFAGADFRIRAARGGLATVVRATVNNGGCDPSYNKYNNYVKVTHQDGTYAFYLHQKFGSIPDFPGGTVAQGQCMGLAGATGYACGAHLHFNVSITSDNSPGVPTLEQNPPNWVVPSFIEGMPKTGTSPVSQNSAASCDQSGDPLTVNPPPINPSAGTCGNGWNQIAGFAGQPAYTPRSINELGDVDTDNRTSRLL